MRVSFIIGFFLYVHQTIKIKDYDEKIMVKNVNPVCQHCDNSISIKIKSQKHLDQSEVKCFEKHWQF
jgi:hypothetical protein